jgi:hypothetical protein
VLDILLLCGWQLPVISIILREIQGICFKAFVQIKPHVASRLLWATACWLCRTIKFIQEKKWTVSSKPIKIKETHISPKQHSSWAGIA